MADQTLQRKALMHQLDLQDKIAVILRLLAAPETNPPVLRKEVLTTQGSLQGLDDYFREICDPKFYNERTMAPSAAQRVFAVPELLEKILLHLPTLATFQAQQVNHQFNEAIEGSVKIQRKLLLAEDSGTMLKNPSKIAEPSAADKSSTTYSRFQMKWSLFEAGALFRSPKKLPGVHHKDMDFGTPLDHQNAGGELPLFSCHLRSCRKTTIYGACSGVTPASYRLTITIEDGKLTLGKRWHRMLVCSPPVFLARAYISCDHNTQHELVSGIDGGLTTGNLYDKAQKMFRDRRLCLCAPLKEYNTVGGSL